MAEEIKRKIPKRVLGTLLSSLSSGVVPRSGAPYIAIGREAELGALLSDLERVRDGGGSMRFLVGRYGSGKSFLIQLVRGYALDRGFVTADCDLSPERRFCGADGVGCATYRELIRNLACKTSPDGGAMNVVLSRWFADLSSKLVGEGYEVGSSAFDDRFTSEIHATMRAVESGVGGFDFASVLNVYYQAYLSGNDDRMSAAVRWLRGEFRSRVEARDALGFRVGSIIDDDNWYDYLKLLASFFREIGYGGLMVFIDECVNLYKIPNRVSRENNYEKILAMFNDTLQGRAPGLMLVLGGTPQFLEDPRRGLFSYEALRSRLADGKYESAEYRNLFSPLIRLRRLSDDELLALLFRLSDLHGQYHDWAVRVTESDTVSFLRDKLSRAGAEELVTPREVIRDYLSLLDVLYQNPNARFADLCRAQNEENKPSGDPQSQSSDPFDAVADVDF